MQVTTALHNSKCVLVAVIVLASATCTLGQGAKNTVAKVDFSYAFATPHRITVGQPDASDRTLLDLQPGSLLMAWSYENLTLPNYPLCTFKTPPATWKILVTPQIDGHPFAQSRWTRLDSVLPALENLYEDTRSSLRMEVIGGASAAVARIELVNRDSTPHQIVVRCDAKSLGENPGWCGSGGKRYAGDNLLADGNGRPDRVLVLGLGAETYSPQADGLTPRKSLLLVWNLKPGEKRVGWLVRPYHSYRDDLPELRKHDWAHEWQHAKKEWHDLMARAPKVSIPDDGVANAYRACLGDLFIMRERANNGQIGSVPGTEMYRAHNPIEAGVVAVALDQNGFHKESAEGYQICLDTQETDGNWNDDKGWTHLMWCCSGFKAWAAMEHYRLTGDKKYLDAVYPRMLASSRWQESQRAFMRPAMGDRPVTYGLMPRGKGDCGLLDDGDHYAVFLPHNIWAVYADRCSLEAAEILGRAEDVEPLRDIYETARADLLAALDRGAIREKEYRWIPAVPGKITGSRWGVLNIAFPCRLLPPNHELVTGTLRYIEANISKGGIPMNTGGMPDGMWVAMALDNVAEVHLARGDGDAAAKSLYATLNHGTPLYTWCEERGQEPGATKCSGDRQHLWTPVAVVRVLRDMLVMESSDGLNLALGTAREWLASGKPVGIAAAPTHFGPVSYQMQYDAAKSQVSGEATFADCSTAAWTVLHIRLPGGLKVKSVNPDSKADVLPDGSGIRWTAPRGTLKFQARVGT